MAAPDWDVGADFVRVAIVVSNNVKRSRMLVFDGIGGARAPLGLRRD